MFCGVLQHLSVKVCKALFEMRNTISFPLAHRATKYVTQMSGYEKAAKIVNSNTYAL